MGRAVKAFTLLVIGGSLYVLLELLFRGYSHFTMFLLGGIMFLLIGGINNWLPWSMGIVWQCLLGMLVITAAEFAAGCILNLWLGLGIWDYSNIPCNLLGQICLPFMGVWFFLSGLAVFLDDWLRYWLFGEERPTYTII